MAKVQRVTSRLSSDLRQERVMEQNALPDENTHQSNRGECDKVDPTIDLALGELSATAQRARAIERRAELGEMAGGIVHDIRNLLAVIESGLRLAEMSSGQPEKVRLYIAAAREGIDRGAKLTSELLAFANQQELDAHAEDANEHLRKLERLLRYGAGPEVRVVLDLASDIPKCLIDPPQFEAAVLNLVINARDAMPYGGEVRISTERCIVGTTVSGSPTPGTYIRVRVKDNGQGMASEVLSKVFDPFFTTKGEKGTGLGLPHVRAFMRLIGGHVSVMSEPGVGTTFDLLLPSVEPTGIVAVPRLNADVGRDFSSPMVS
jgi:signal transduction histidine kinase